MLPDSVALRAGRCHARLVRRRRVPPLAAMAAVAVLASCTSNLPPGRPAETPSSSAPSIRSSPTPSPVPSGPRATRLIVDQTKRSGFPEALVGGVLQIDKAGCVTMDDYTLVAPYGSTLAQDGRTVTLTGHGVFRIGERFGPAGGGYIDNPGDTPTEPRGCARNDFVSVNPGDL